MVAQSWQGEGRDSWNLANIFLLELASTAGHLKPLYFLTTGTR